MTRRAGGWWLIAAPVWAIVIGGWLLVSLAGTEGAGVVLLLAVPVLVSAVPLLVPMVLRRFAAWGCVAVLGAAVVVSLASIGLFYVPGVALLAIGATRTEKFDASARL